ncbi:MAG: hypothetical protein ACTSVY_09395 [Candidatus Helarchaeota archaeon]
MESGASKISENLKEEIYNFISEMVEEQIFESLESIKGDIEELIRMIFSPKVELDKFDKFTQERIESLQDVFKEFKNKLKKEILNEIINSNFKKDLINEMKKELLIHSKNVGNIPRSSIGRKKVILVKPKQKRKKKTKKTKKT